MPRYRSEEEWQEAKLSRARKIWDEREKGFHRHVRQTWEQGTRLARIRTLEQAEQELKAESNAAAN